MNILIPLGAFLAAAVTPLAKRILAGLGLGILSFAAVTTALNAAISLAQGYFTGLPSTIFGLAGLAGLGEGMGIIAGAMVAKVTFNTLKRIGVLPT